jgi:hypothetical protein
MKSRFLLLHCLLPLLLVLAHAQQKTAKPTAPSVKAADDSQLYRNSTFGFRYRIPFGWVDRTKDLQDADEQKQDEGSKSQSGKGETGVGDTAKGEVLLAVFERPPEAAGDTVNSAVVIASESAASYPGMTSAEDYLDQLDEITTAKGFKPDGDPEEVTIDSRNLVRADFTKPLNDKLTMYQSTLVLLGKKQVVSFTFIAGSKDEIDELIDALSFPPASRPKK